MTISKFKFGTYFIIDPEKHLISCNFVAHLGIDPNEVDRYVTTPLIKQEMEYLILGKAYKQTVSDKVGQYEHYMLTLSQVNEVIANAPQPDMVLELVAFISQEIIPLFNPVVKVEPAQNKHSHKFHSDLFGDLTVLTHDDGSLWFIGKEVCDKLGYTNSRKALNDHCRGVTKRYIKLNQLDMFETEVNIIPERDVYRLVMRSKLPTAEKFEEFVVSEVLPSIRKTGSYGQPPQIAAITTPTQLENKLTDHRPTKQSNASFLKIAIAQIDMMNLPVERKQILKAHLMHEQAGLPLDLMLPVVYEEKLSPAQIALRMNVSAQAIGHIITKLGIRGNETYCEPRLSYVERSNRDVIVHFYNNQAVNMIKQALKDKQNEKKN